MSATHVRHPWFHTFVAKRKVPAGNPISGNSSPEDDEFADLAPHRPPKRRRCTTLERGFAHLSLSHTFPAAETPEDMDMPMDSDVPVGAPSAVASNNFNKVELPSSVEEPALANVDVRMQTYTWYEPEPDRRYLAFLADARKD